MAITNGLQKNMQGAKPFALNMARVDLNEIQPILVVLSDFGVSTSCVLRIMCDSPYLDVPTLCKEITFEPSTEWESRLARVLDIVLEQPIIDSSFPSGLDLVTVFCNLPTAKARLPHGDTHSSETTLDSHCGDIVSGSDFVRALSFGVEPSDLFFRDVAVFMVVSASGVRGASPCLHRWVSQDAGPIPLTPIDANSLQVICDGLKCHTVLVANLLEGHMFVDIQPGKFARVSERSHGFTRASLVRTGDRTVDGWRRLYPVARNTEVCPTIGTLAFKPSFTDYPSSHSLPPANVMSNGHYSTARVQPWQ